MRRAFRKRLEWDPEIFGCASLQPARGGSPHGDRAR